MFTAYLCLKISGQWISVILIKHSIGNNNNYTHIIPNSYLLMIYIL